MEQFQITVLTIATIILILCLIIIGITLYRSKYSDIFPPVLGNCPDYWLDESKGDSSNCVNVKNLGNDGCEKRIDFSKKGGYGSTNGLCRKKNWAKSCNITWDGITNNDDLVC